MEMVHRCCRCNTTADSQRLAVSEPSKSRPDAPAIWPDAMVGYFCSACWEKCVKYYNQFDALEDKP